MAVFFSIRFLVLAILAIAGIFNSRNYAVSGQMCQIDVPDLIAKCAQFVQKSGPKVAPSQGCCKIIKLIDVPCACKYVTKEVEQIISMEKAVYVAKFCGLALRHGMKCGSYTVPAGS